MRVIWVRSHLMTSPPSPPTPMKDRVDDQLGTIKVGLSCEKLPVKNSQEETPEPGARRRKQGDIRKKILET